MLVLRNQSWLQVIVIHYILQIPGCNPSLSALTLMRNRVCIVVDNHRIDASKLAYYRHGILWLLWLLFCTLIHYTAANGSKEPEAMVAMWSMVANLWVESSKTYVLI